MKDMIDSSDKRYVIGVDPGGTKIAAAVADHGGEVLVKSRSPPPKGT
jgi:predicted NBD/HSP70 family sugar kinase